MIVVSACLAGVNCNYKGRSSEVAAVAELVRDGKAIMVCPEQLGGLGTPRVPAEIKDNRVITKTGIDVTEAFVRGADEVLNICKKYHCRKAILKSNSPSCGCGKIYDGNFTGTLIEGNGITAALLMKNGMEVTAIP